ncbi:T9SS type A sorting domain-containing protein [bacterium]|nr:T9SS type A sorting domain-containing protein [bacterium]
MKSRLLLLGFLLISCFTLSKAQYIGSDLTYRSLDSFEFEITYSLYRDCRATPLGNPGTGAKLYSTCGTKSLSLKLVSITEISPLSDTVAPRCSPANTTATGEGVEIHIYRDTVDFRDANYSSLLSCCKIDIEISTCCRPASITTGSANSTFYNRSTIDLCKAPTNSSPYFGFYPKFRWCLNQPLYLNPGAADTFDFDSLSFIWEYPRSSRTNSITYTTTCQVPVEVYFPGSLTCPYNNPSTSPPIGYYFDPTNGNLILTPTDYDLSSLTLKVTEWRKDSSGTYEIIGETRRDHLFFVDACQNNNEPKLDGPYSYQVCEGEQLCFIIESEDNGFTPPPPASTINNDTTTLTWNHAIPDATFEIVNDTVDTKSARFCWTPPIGSAQSLPYQFAVEVRDNNEYTGISQRSYALRVKKKAFATVSIDSLDCGYYTVNSAIDTTFVGTASYRWEIKDTSGRPLSSNEAYFLSTGGYLGINAADTFKIKEGGLYVIEHTINNSPNNCPTTYYDTIKVGSSFHATLDYTDTTICIGESLTLSPVVKYENGSVQYQWYMNGNIMTADTNRVLEVKQKIGEKDTFKLMVNDGFCDDQITVTVQTVGTVYTGLLDSVFSCNDPIELDLQASFDSLLWSNSKTDTAITESSSGLYSFYAEDSFGCSYRDTSYLTIYQTVEPQLTDTSLCEDMFLLNPGSYSSYIWNDGSSGSTLMANSTGLYKVTVEDQNGCKQEDSAYVEIFGTPVLTLQNDTNLCCNSGLFDLSELLGSTDPQTGTWTNSTYPNSISSGQFDPNSICSSVPQESYLAYYFKSAVTGCEYFDSLKITVNPIPSFALIDAELCRDEEEINLTQNVVVSSQTLGLGQEWSCIQCNGNVLDSFLQDRSVSSIPEYWLVLDSAHYTMSNEDSDTIILSMRFTDGNSCSKADTASIILYSNPDKPILQKQDEYIRITNSDDFVRWYRDGNLLSNTDTFIFADTAGTYTARNVNEAGCESEMSDGITRTIGVYELVDHRLEIAPNPTNGEVKLRFDMQELGEPVSIKVYNSLGALIESTNHNNEEEYIVRWSGADGIYYIEVEFEESVVRKAVLLQN